MHDDYKYGPQPSGGAEPAVEYDVYAALDRIEAKAEDLILKAGIARELAESLRDASVVLDSPVKAPGPMTAIVRHRVARALAKAKEAGLL